MPLGAVPDTVWLQMPILLSPRFSQVMGIVSGPTVTLWPIFVQDGGDVDAEGYVHLMVGHEVVVDPHTGIVTAPKWAAPALTFGQIKFALVPTVLMTGVADAALGRDWSRELQLWTTRNVTS